jgi:hypothetical protein
MAIGTPTDLGTGSENSNPSTGFTITTTANAPSGSKVLLHVVVGSTTPGTVTVSDNSGLGNTWTQEATASRGAHTHYVYRCDLSAQMNSGTVITVGFSTGGIGSAGSAEYITGLATGTFDKSATNQNLNQTPSTGTTATTSVADEIDICTFAVQLNGTTRFDPAAGFTEMSESTPSTRAICVARHYKIVSATGAQSEAATAVGWVSNQNWTGTILTYSIASGTTVNHVIGNVTLGAVAPTVTFAGTVTHVIGNITLGATAPTISGGTNITTTAGVLALSATDPVVNFAGTVTHVIGNVTLGAVAPAITSGTVVSHVIGNVQLSGGTHTLTGAGGATVVYFVSSPAPAILYLMGEGGPLGSD